MIRGKNKDPKSFKRDEIFFKYEGIPNLRYLDKFVKKRAVCRILPNLETEQDDVLIQCVLSF